MMAMGCASVLGLGVTAIMMLAAALSAALLRKK
jgi:hypothetical protein